jgi:hypothetical protein
MKNSDKIQVFVFCLLLAPAIWADDHDQVVAELDAFWSEVSRAVGEGDLEGYAATYHPDAVLVSGLNGTSHPIKTALARWREDFEDTRTGAMKASVEFRFTARWHDDTTAHETGIFRYVTTLPNGITFEQLLHFEALLVKKDDWKMMMELQRSFATPEHWEAALDGT